MSFTVDDVSILLFVETVFATVLFSILSTLTSFLIEIPFIVNDELQLTVVVMLSRFTFKFASQLSSLSPLTSTVQVLPLNVAVSALAFTKIPL